MSLAADTNPEADALQIEAYRRMGGAARLQISFRLSAMARQASVAGIKARHPDYDSTQVVMALARLLHGDEIARRVWPGRELPEP